MMCPVCGATVFRIVWQVSRRLTERKTLLISPHFISLRCSFYLMYLHNSNQLNSNPFFQMGRLHVPRLQGAAVHLRERGFQALERLGGPRTADPVCPACARHAVAQEGLFHCPRPGSGSWPQTRPRPRTRPHPGTSRPSRHGWSQLSRILTHLPPLPTAPLPPHAADSACPLP